MSVLGFSGQAQNLPLTVPLPVVVGKQQLSHSFLYSPDCPINLLVRDLLVELGASVMCDVHGFKVTLPDGTELCCSPAAWWNVSEKQCMLSESVDPALPTTADIYWGLFQTDSDVPTTVFGLYTLWKAWIDQHATYFPPSDPLHCTLFYDRNQDLVYRDEFDKQLSGR